MPGFLRRKCISLLGFFKLIRPSITIRPKPRPSTYEPGGCANQSPFPDADPENGRFPNKGAEWEELKRAV